jgi:glycosyltransferase involved in cell wall biosynthesis
MHEAGVDYRGYVEDLRDIYRQSRVYVAPINSGGGIRTKIVEAMAAGVPVVCNSFAPLGLGLLPDHHVVVRDRAEDSAAAILRLLRDDAHWLRVRDAARAFVESSFSLQRVGPRIAQRYLEFLREAA